MHRRPIHPRTRRRGLSLVEAMICVVLVSTMLVAALGTVGAAARVRFAQRDESRGLGIARQLLPEIMQVRYKDPGSSPVFGVESGQVRSTYDDVDDYNGLSETPPKYADGNAVTGFTGWKRTVLVEWVNPSDPTGAAASSETNLKRITITVTDPNGKVTKLVALRSNYDGYEKTFSSTITYTCWAGVTVQVGSDSANRTTQAAALSNQMP